MKKFRLALFLILLAACHHFAFAQLKFNGKVVEIINGKTVVIEVQPTRNKLTAILQYIEVPEPEQELHKTVKDHLQTLLLGKNVEFSAKQIMPTETIGQMFLDNVDISQQMLRDGAAWYSVLDRDKQDAAESEKYKVVELQAKLEKIGVWSIPNMKTAWEFRADKEEKSNLAQQSQNPLDFTLKNTNKPKSVFGQPRYGSETQQQSEIYTWANVGKNSITEKVNAAGLVSQYVASANFGYLATTVAKFNLPTGSNFPKIVYRIGYFYRGSTLKTGNDAYLIGLLSESNSWKFAQTNNLSVMVDGQLISLGSARRLSNQSYSSVQELLLYKISRSTLLKIANSKQVKFKIGKYSGVVEKRSQNQVETLLDYSK